MESFSDPRYFLHDRGNLAWGPSIDPMPADTVTRVRSPLRVDLPDHGVVVRESRHAPGFSGDMDDPYAKFHLLIAGRATWEGVGQRHHVGPGMLYFIAAQTPHRQRDLADDPVTLYFVHFRPEVLPAPTYAALAADRLLPLDLTAAPMQIQRTVHALFQEMLYEQEARRSGWEGVLLARLLDLCVLSLRLKEQQAAASPAPVISGRDGESALRVAAYAKRQESTFYLRESIEEAADSVHLSRRRFTELFRAQTGETWLRRLQRLRLDHACQLLTATERSVTAIAFECGFDDLSHFHHTFRARFACTPGEWRERHCPIPHP